MSWVTDVTLVVLSDRRDSGGMIMSTRETSRQLQDGAGPLQYPHVISGLDLSVTWTLGTKRVWRLHSFIGSMSYLVACAMKPWWNNWSRWLTRECQEKELSGHDSVSFLRYLMAEGVRPCADETSPDFGSWQDGTWLASLREFIWEACWSLRWWRHILTEISWGSGNTPGSSLVTYIRTVGDSHRPGRVQYQCGHLHWEITNVASAMLSRIWILFFYYKRYSAKDQGVVYNKESTWGGNWHRTSKVPELSCYNKWGDFWERNLDGVWLPEHSSTGKK